MIGFEKTGWRCVSRDDLKVLDIFWTIDANGNAPACCSRGCAADVARDNDRETSLRSSAHGLVPALAPEAVMPNC